MARKGKKKLALTRILRESKFNRLDVPVEGKHLWRGTFEGCNSHVTKVYRYVNSDINSSLYELSDPCKKDNPFRSYPWATVMRDPRSVDTYEIRLYKEAPHVFD